MVTAGGSRGLSPVYGEFFLLTVLELQNSLLYNAQVLIHM